MFRLAFEQPDFEAFTPGYIETTSYGGSAEDDTAKVGECEWCGGGDAENVYALIMRMIGSLDGQNQEQVLERLRTSVLAGSGPLKMGACEIYGAGGAEEGYGSGDDDVLTVGGVETAAHALTMGGAETAAHMLTMGGANEHEIMDFHVDDAEIEFRVDPIEGAAEVSFEIEELGDVNPPENVEFHMVDESNEPTEIEGAAEKYTRAKAPKVVMPAPLAFVSKADNSSLDDFSFEANDTAPQGDLGQTSVTDIADNPYGNTMFNEWVDSGVTAQEGLLEGVTQFGLDALFDSLV